MFMLFQKKIFQVPPKITENMPQNCKVTDILLGGDHSSVFEFVSSGSGALQ